MNKEEIKELKKDLKITWVEMAELVGCSLQSINNWIYRDNSPSPVFEAELRRLRKQADQDLGIA